MAVLLLTILRVLSLSSSSLTVIDGSFFLNGFFFIIFWLISFLDWSICCHGLLVWYPFVVCLESLISDYLFLADNTFCFFFVSGHQSGAWNQKIFNRLKIDCRRFFSRCFVRYSCSNVVLSRCSCSLSCGAPWSLSLFLIKSRFYFSLNCLIIVLNWTYGAIRTTLRKIK